MECGLAPVIPRPKPSSLGGRAYSYSVIRVSDCDGCVMYELVETRLFRQREKAIHEAYLKAAREWKPGQDPKAPQQQPTKPEVRIWRTVMGGPDALERAQAVLDDCRRKEKEKEKGEDLKKPEGKPAATPEKAPATSTKAPAEPEKKIPGPLVK